MPSPKSRLSLPRRAVLLFQGDSITDCLRDRSRTAPNDPAALGAGYAGRLAAELLSEHPGAGWRIFNRAISGDRSVDLVARWRRDALALKPDLVSILCGVNDTWHEALSGNGVPLPRFVAFYRILLEETRRARPRVKLVLGEPFVLEGGALGAAAARDVRRRGEAVRELAGEFGAAFVPYQAMFDAARKRFSLAELGPDGVHPSPVGHRLMADAWRQCVGT